MARSAISAAFLAGSLLSTPALGAEPPLSARNAFRVGNDGVLCTAQNKPTDPHVRRMFDRAWLLTCRDAAAPVGSLVELRGAAAMFDPPNGRTCEAPTSADLPGLGPVQQQRCRDPKLGVEYRSYAVRRGKMLARVEGLAGYDPALRLALASVLADRSLPGRIEVATTEAGDPAAFARIQAGALDGAGARTEAYIRNNGGRFAESAQFFEALAERERGTPQGLAEALANQGLQQSNLGNHRAARALFMRAAQAAPNGDAVLQRLIRNYRALDRLNARDPDGALSALTVMMPPVAIEGGDDLRAGLITLPVSAEINRDSESGQQLRAVESQLTKAERAELLDAQAQALGGTAARQKGQLDIAAREMAGAARRIGAVHGGRVVSTSWLLADIGMEQAMVAEARGDRAGAMAGFDSAIAAIARAYPDSPTLLMAKARKAALMARLGDRNGATALFDAVIAQSRESRDSGAGLHDLLGPYFALLADSGAPDAAAKFFAAAQVLQRPGVAQTQAILARQLSEGNDEAATLFRLAVARTREIARTDAEVSRLAGRSDLTPAEQQNLSSARANLAALSAEQTALQSRLGNYARYRVLEPQGVELTELQKQLQPGEAYWKISVVDDSVYGLIATPAGARIWRSTLSRPDLEATVQAIRDSIAHRENGQTVTVPFELARARGLYVALAGPADAEIRGAHHLVVEPDGAMLQLPPALLPISQPGVDVYQARAAANGDAFDFTGVDWLGRGREISISVGPRSFIDLRQIAPSHARRGYLGLGGNAIPTAKPIAAVASECDWPLAAWQAPIPTDELDLANRLIGRGSGAEITGAAFTDTALLADRDLDQYRILHFATHGLVTAPRPECPARPALLTSFGGANSDGLLSFREIFDLKLDADVVILSACDTAGLATVAASREAGLTTGGNYALDGLVRAFVGAGARSVVASHWPVPDEFDATKRLIGGLVSAQRGEPLAAALARSEGALMDDPKTSHPFYWAAFIILGDGAKPLVPAQVAAAGGRSRVR